MKRKLSILLVIIILVSLPLSSVYADAQSTSLNHENAITNTIASILHEKEIYGFTNESIADLWIASPIPCYEVINCSFVAIDNLLYYPILNNSNELVSIIGVTTDNTSTKTYLLPDFTNLLNEHFDFSDGISLCFIYDNLSCYAYSGNTSYLLQENNERDRVFSRDSLSDVQSSAYQSITARQIVRETYIDLSTIAAPCGDGDNYVYINNVPIVTQPTTHYWCWAACMASLVKFELGLSYTCVEMGQMISNDISSGRSTTLVRTDLQSMFNLYYNMQNNTNITNMLQSMNNGHPVYGDFQGSNEGHAMIIRGVDLSTNTFSVMDPTSSTYRTGTVTTSGNYGTFSILKSNNALTYTLYRYLYMP